MRYQTACFWIVRIGLIFGFGLLLCFLIRRIREQWLITVQQTSKRYLRLSEINRCFEFDARIRMVYTFTVQLKTKHQFDTFQYEPQIVKLIEQNSSFLMI